MRRRWLADADRRSLLLARALRVHGRGVVHELSLAQSICDTVRAHLPPGQKVRTVVVEWGPLSGVVPESLEFCFDIVAKRAGLAEAKLELRSTRPSASCPACQASFTVEQMWAECPECGHGPVTVAGGREFRLKEIEVDDV